VDKRSASTISPADGFMLAAAAQIWNCRPAQVAYPRTITDNASGNYLK
jgi:hypothetical protein